MSPNTEITANGRRFRLNWAGKAGPLWLVFPGLRYRLDFAALARVQQVAMAAGARTCGVETAYDQDARLADLSQADAVALIREDARAILAQLPAPDILVGKSVGCVSLIEANLPKARYIWMTPNLTADVAMETIQTRAPRSFIVAGGDDPVTPPDLLQRSGARHVVLPGMGHALSTGDDTQAAPIFDHMGAALQRWL